MATNFPSGLDSFTNPSATDSMDSVSVPHASQHANLNDAVEALEAKVGANGSAVTSSLDYKVAQQGLVLVKTQTIGTAVSSVTVTGAFSSTFDNYRIIVGGGVGTTAANIRLKLGSTTSGYYAAIPRLVYSTNTFSTLTDYDTGVWTRAGAVSTSGMMLNADLLSPNLATRTVFSGRYALPDPVHTGGSVDGFLNTSTQYTAFTIDTSSGTMTGGTIRVYGYNNG